MTKSKDNMQDKLEYIETYNNSDSEAEYVIIWLHGLGASGDDFVSIAASLKLDANIRFIFPHAPFRNITINNNMKMRAWYDIRDVGRLSYLTDTDGIINSLMQVEALIAALINEGYNSSKILLAGFSQGGVICYNYAIMGKHRLNGIIALSCYLPNMEQCDFHNATNKTTNILVCHGKYDELIPYNTAFEVYKKMRDCDFNISWLHYEIGHEVCIAEIKDIEQWLNNKCISVLNG